MPRKDKKRQVKQQQKTQHKNKEWATWGFEKLKNILLTSIPNFTPHINCQKNNKNRIENVKIIMSNRQQCAFTPAKKSCTSFNWPLINNVY